MEPNEDPEIVAMSKIRAALNDLPDEETKVRVLRWAVEKYRAKTSQALGRTQGQTLINTGLGTAETPQPGEFADFPALFSAASPQTDVDRALVAGYWFQIVRGAEDLTGQQLNEELKQMGHRVGNITDALSSLIERRPAFVIQTHKSGSSRQARKKYRLTTEGIRAVEQMLSQAASAPGTT